MPNELIKYRICDKCPNETLAVETHKVSLNGYRYELDLCEEHAAQLYVVVMDWADLGTLVGEPTVFDKPRVLASERAERQLGDKTPRVRRPSVEPEPVAHTGPVVADYAHKWTFTDHARLRLGQREISEWDALRAAERPEYTRPDKKKRPDALRHYRGDLFVVVNPYTHEIITAARPSEDESSPTIKEKVATGGH